MGVQGLLPMLKSVMDQVHVAKYKGKRVGIDASGWLYKGCYSCAMDVVLGRDTDAYLNFCLQHIKLFQEHEITPIFVFDGAPLPAKAEQNASRNRTRSMWKTKAMRILEDGDEAGAAMAFNKAVSVTNDMVMKLIAILRRMEIQYYVAPYEADAQLAYLSRSKIIDVVISEDSDCIPYGCRTVLFKITVDGWASELKRRSLGANEDLSFVGWTEEMFVQLCVLCGCDYCPSVPGIGIITAYKIVNVHRKPLDVLAALKQQKGSVLPEDYGDHFFAAVLTFRHHLVFDPRDKKMKMLNPLSVSEELVAHVPKDLCFLGNLELRDDVVISIAEGVIHPITHESYAWKETAAQEAVNHVEDACLYSMTSSETSSNVGLEPDAILASRLDLLRSRTRPTPDEEPSKPPSSSWRHLDSVLGTSSHILNFKSPKVSENFRSLISQETRGPVFRAGRTAEQLKEYENKPVRENLKRVRNPQNRKRETQRSGFDGEVSCRIDASEPNRSTQRRKLNESTRNDDPSTPLHQVDQSFDASSLVRPPSSSGSSPRHVRADPSLLSSNRFLLNLRNNIPSGSIKRVFSGLPTSEQESPSTWTLQSSYKNVDAHLGLSALTSASYAEQKWDRILEAELEASDEDDQVSSVLSSRSSNPNTVVSESHTSRRF